MELTYLVKSEHGSYLVIFFLPTTHAVKLTGAREARFDMFLFGRIIRDHWYQYL